MSGQTAKGGRRTSEHDHEVRLQGEREGEDEREPTQVRGRGDGVQRFSGGGEAGDTGVGSPPRSAGCTAKGAREGWVESALEISRRRACVGSGGGRPCR